MVRRGLALVGFRIISSCRYGGFCLRLWWEVILLLPQGLLIRRRDILSQMRLSGVQSFPVTIIVGIFTGMIISLQTGLTLRDYNLQNKIGVIIVATLFKELGPFMTAFILAGRVGSAMAAEIGTMQVSEEIEALRMMSINPVSFLVIPRFAALVLFAPILTIYADAVGILGGAVVGEYQVGVHHKIYFDSVMNYIRGSDWDLILGGLFKSMIFGVIISIVGCANGLLARNGAAGVGKATRKCVVDSFLLILIFNYFMSSFINRLWR